MDFEQSTLHGAFYLAHPTFGAIRKKYLEPYN